MIDEVRKRRMHLHRGLLVKCSARRRLATGIANFHLQNSPLVRWVGEQQRQRAVEEVDLVATQHLVEEEDWESMCWLRRGQTWCQESVEAKIRKLGNGEGNRSSRRRQGCTIRVQRRRRRVKLTIDELLMN